MALAVLHCVDQWEDLTHWVKLNSTAQLRPPSYLWVYEKQRQTKMVQTMMILVKKLKTAFKYPIHRDYITESKLWLFMQTNSNSLYNTKPNLLATKTICRIPQLWLFYIISVIQLDQRCTLIWLIESLSTTQTIDLNG